MAREVGSPQQSIRTTTDIPVCIAGTLNREAYAPLARVVADGSAVVKAEIGRHLWRMGCVTLRQCVFENSWFRNVVLASPTVLGHKVYRELKQSGRLSWRNPRSSR